MACPPFIQANFCTRPHPAQWRSQYLDQSSDAFAESVGKGYGSRLKSLPILMFLTSDSSEFLVMQGMTQ
jgi:hypothetical protein